MWPLASAVEDVLSVGVRLKIKLKIVIVVFPSSTGATAKAASSPSVRDKTRRTRVLLAILWGR
jgi:hypothetical protein